MIALYLVKWQHKNWETVDWGSPPPFFLCHLKRSLLGPVVQLVWGDSATIFIDTEFKGNLSDMKTADYKKTFYRALTLKGSGSLQGLSIGKVTDLEGAPGYKLVTKLQSGRKMPRAMDLSWRRCWDNLLKPMVCWFPHWTYHCWAKKCDLWCYVHVLMIFLNMCMPHTMFLQVPFFTLVTVIFWHQLCWQRWKWLGHCSPELDLRLTVMALRWWHNWAQEELYKSCGEVWYQHATRRWRIPCCKLWRASGVQRYQRASRLTCRRSTRILIPTSERSDDD